jgi:hypothetical protein
LIPRQLRENGLRPGEVIFSDAALEKLIRSYTREAGVRNMEREIGSVCRKVVTMIAEAGVEGMEVTPEKIQELLGRPHFFSDEEIAWRTSIPGVATGLAWTPFGGDVLFIEATRMPGNKGFQITGSIGNVMQESAHAALSFVRSKPVSWSGWRILHQSDIHLHIPAGATPTVLQPASLLPPHWSRWYPVARSAEWDDRWLPCAGRITGRHQEKVLAAHRSAEAVVLQAIMKPTWKISLRKCARKSSLSSPNLLTMS